MEKLLNIKSVHILEIYLQKRKNVTKKQIRVTSSDKAVQTIGEEKGEIQIEDLTCTSTFKIILLFIFLCAFLKIRNIISIFY